MEDLTSDIELGSPPTPSLPSPLHNPEHIAAVVTSVALFLATMVVTFITQPPPTTDFPNPFLYITYMFSIYLAFFIGVGLSAQLLLSPANSNNMIIWIHRKLSLMGLGLFSVTFVLRTCMTSPLHILWIVWALLLLFITVAIIIVILIIRKYRP